MGPGLTAGIVHALGLERGGSLVQTLGGGLTGELVAAFGPGLTACIVDAMGPEFTGGRARREPACLKRRCASLQRCIAYAW